MEELLSKLHALSEDKQNEVLENILEAIVEGRIGAGMTEAAKNEIAMDYDDLYFYARKNNGSEAAMCEVVEYVKEEDEDEYEELIKELIELIK